MEALHTFAIMAYKDSEFLEQCIKSLLCQTVKSEIVITTSTPSDYIMDIANQYEISVIVNENPPGIASDWQFAVDSCKTPYFTLAHQDDLYYETYTQMLLPHMENSLIAFCNYEEAIGQKTRSKTKMLKIKRILLWPFSFKKSLKSRFFKKLILRFGSPVCCPSVMYNSKLTNGPVFNAALKNNLDWDAWIRFSKMNGAFFYSKKILMAHRIHEQSETTKQISDGGRSKEDLQMFCSMWPEFIAKKLAKFYSKSYDSNSNLDE